MKKLLIVLVLLLVIGIVAFAEEDKFTVDAGAGLYYDAYPLSGTAFDFLIILFGLRGGVFGDLNFMLSDGMSVGIEAGVAYMTVTSGVEPDTVSSSLFDIPLYATFRYSFGGVAVQPYAGMLFTGAASDAGGEFVSNVAAGARILLGSVFAEAAYVIGLGPGAVSFPRFGLGAQFNNLVSF